MFIPKWLLESVLSKQDDLERRVKRLELIALKNAQDAIASLGDDKAGTISKDGLSTIEEIINK